MAAFGILAALREAERTGEGQVVDVAMADGALSWLALVAARHLADGERRRRARGMLELAGGLACYRPYACADGGWVTLGALEPKFWAAWCRGVGREDLVGEQFAAPGSDGARRGRGDLRGPHARASGRRSRAEHECCLEPVLDLDEALASEHVRAREMVVGLDQPGAAEPVSLLGAPVKLSRTPADTNRLPGPAARRAHRGGAARGRLRRGARSRSSSRTGAVAGPPDPADGAGGLLPRVSGAPRSCVARSRRDWVDSGSPHTP